MAGTMRLGALPILGRSVQMGDVYAGAALGVAGNVLINYLDQMWAKAQGPVGVQQDGSVNWQSPLSKLPVQIRPLLGPALAGALAFFATRRKWPSRAEGLLAGAVGAGIYAAVKQTGATAAANAAQTDPNSLMANLNFAGVPVTLVTPGLQPRYRVNGMGDVVVAPAYGRLGAVYAQPSPYRSMGRMGEVVAGPGYGSKAYADQVKLEGMGRASEQVMHDEFAPI